MKHYFFMSLLAVLLAMGCGKEPPPIDKSQMVDILMDVHIAEAVINNQKSSIKKELEEQFLVQVFDKWKITKPEFEAALSHMHSDPDYMRDVYETLKAQLEAYSQELDKEGSMNPDSMLE